MAFSSPMKGGRPLCLMPESAAAPRPSPAPQGRPAPGLHGAELVQSCVALGLVRLLLSPTAITPADCPEILLLDCG